MTGKYLLDENKIPVPVSDVREWAFGFENLNRYVAATGFKVWAHRKPRKGGYKRDPKRISVWVSTVFIGLDYNFENTKPRVFESMAFFKGIGRRSPFEQCEIRHCTWDEALAGHKELCKAIRKFHIKR